MRVLLLSFLLLLTGFGDARADGWRLTRFDQLPADAEVHAVTISAPLSQGVSYDEITDWQALVRALRAKDGPGTHIRRRLPEGAEADIVNERAEMGRINDSEGLEPDTVSLLARARLSRVLNAALETTTFYDRDVFAGVELSKRAKELVALGHKRTVYQNELLNRELLAATFPKCVAPAPLDYHITRVKVKPGKPVVLVLSCSVQCRWEVTVEKGATVAGVVLFGNAAQELAGVDAPVVYDAKQLRDGREVETVGSHATKREGKCYELMCAAVRNMTGRDFTDFQGHSKGTKEPFVVTPSAK